MSPVSSNVATVQSIYEAFGRGDVPHILSCMSADVQWEYGFSPSEVPWLQQRSGVDGVVGFFEALAGGFQITAFAPKELLAGQDKVVALVDIEGVVPRTGARIAEQDEVHIWHFSAEGKVTRFRHVLDTHQHHRAWAGA
jgi:ketosteroid isomerase-like protein